MLISINIGEVETFPNVEPDKAQALKVVEEAAEVFSAWEKWHKSPAPHMWAEDIANECADVIQAVCNLMEGLSKTLDMPYLEDMAYYMDACAERNRERGRM